MRFLSYAVNSAAIAIAITFRCNNPPIDRIGTNGRSDARVSVTVEPRSITPHVYTCFGFLRLFSRFHPLFYTFSIRNIVFSVFGFFFLFSIFLLPYDASVPTTTRTAVTRTRTTDYHEDAVDEGVEDTRYAPASADDNDATTTANVGQSRRPTRTVNTAEESLIAIGRRYRVFALTSSALDELGRWTSSNG